MSDVIPLLEALNPNALIAVEGEHIVFIEDVLDLDQRWYRIEVKTVRDGTRAAAWCRHSPWGDVSAADYRRGHLFEDGFICIGAGLQGRRPEDSSLDVETVVRRARFWAVAYSVLRTEGHFPNP